MPLDDSNFSETPKKLTSNRFYKTGILLIALGIFITSGILIFSYLYFESVDKNPLTDPIFYIPLIIGFTPFLFSRIYAYFENSKLEPLKINWSNIHFYLTVIPLFIAQLLTIPFLLYFPMGTNPFTSLFSPIPLSWIFIIVGQLIFLANIFRSLKLSFYENSNFHPTHILFLFAASFFLLKTVAVYFFGKRNSAWDLQMHDTYFVISYFHIYLFFAFIFLLFAVVYYFLNKKLEKPLHPLLSKFHFFLMLGSILFFVYVYLGFDFSVKRYYSSTEGMVQYQNFIKNQLWVGLGCFLLAQIVFLINFLRSLYFGFFRKINN